MVPIETEIEDLRQRAQIPARVWQQLDQMASEIECLRSAGELGDNTGGILSHWFDELVAGRLTEEQARAIPGQLVAARDLMLSAFAEMERGPEVDKDNLYDSLAFVFKSSDITGVAQLVIQVYQLGLRIDIDQIQAFLIPFLHRNSIDEIIRRLDRLGKWMTQFDGRNYEGVMFTPVVTRYLAEHSDFEAALAEFDRLRAETLKGQFRLDNELQRDLEFLRFAHLNANINGGRRGSDEQYATFKALPVLPPPREGIVELSEEHLAQAKRYGYQAACFLQFLRHFKARTPRPIVVVGNDRYGRQWVVEPLQDYLKDDFTLRYDRIRSHSSFRLRVPHEVESKARAGFPQDFVRELNEKMPHVVVVDARNPVRGPGMMKMSRGARDYVNWFMVFNDVRAEGDISKYAHDGAVPHLSELRKWYEFDVVRRLIKPWVNPGSTYKITHWAPELKEYVMLGDFAMRAEYPDPMDDKPQVVISNADIYRTEGDDIYETLRGTQPYYFDGPEQYVKETVEFGFGEYGLETHVKGPTTDEFVARVQQEITAEVERLLQSNAVPTDGVIERR
ncbi:hypothetical protein C6502_21565 [Candidatus Poribacteria bacterium]|nr:MAG: hypothetical protein C6502_21565 [Candidatus Poribacteria bacterium]